MFLQESWPRWLESIGIKGISHVTFLGWNSIEQNMKWLKVNKVECRHFSMASMYSKCGHDYFVELKNISHKICS